LAAAQAAAGGGPNDAETVAIARTAAHRLARGVWTSSGGGCIRRAIAACERLVTLLGEGTPEAGCECRDLGALYALTGRPSLGRPLLQAWADCGAAAAASAAERRALDVLLSASLDSADAPPPTRRKGLPW
jgi:hypothetical protein